MVWEIFGEEAFSVKQLVERILKESDSLNSALTGIFDKTHSTGNVLKVVYLKDALPETLGDPKDKGFSIKLGSALRKRKDQIFQSESPNGQFQLLNSGRDNHNKVQKWKICFIAGSEGDAGSILPYDNEKIINYIDDDLIIMGSVNSETEKDVPALPTPPADMSFKNIEEYLANLDDQCEMEDEIPVPPYPFEVEVHNDIIQ